MKRRHFLKNTAISLPIMLGGVQLSSLAYSQKLARLTNSSEENDRVLVLIQLNGGNDGLSTLVPLNQYDNLVSVRKNVLIPETKLHKLRKYELGFHPSFEKISGLFRDHLVGIIQNVGYPEPNLSHFRSTDIWTSASDSSVVESSGWLGRHLQNEFPEYPTGFPNEDSPDPLAITVGSLVSNTCQGPSVNMSIPVENLNSFDQIIGGDGGQLPDSPYGQELGFVREAIRQTNAYNSVLSEAVQRGVNKVTYPAKSANKLAYQLEIVARLISSGLKTRVYVVNLGGFDTHSSQVDVTDPAKGKHSELLLNISEAVHLFMQDLELQGLQDKVVGMTFSEFGRRIKSNESYGTDHGEAAPMFFFGSKVNPVVFGANPIIEKDVHPKANLPMEFDFRSVYGSVMEDWFGTPKQVIEDVLSITYENIPILRRGEIITGLAEQAEQDYLLQNFPNPFNDSTIIPFRSIGGNVKLSLHNQNGQLVSVLIDKQISRGKHEYKLHRGDLRAGVYICKLKVRDEVYVKTLIVN